ncbi:MAG: DUF4440 domain-containing protein [bacterium]
MDNNLILELEKKLMDNDVRTNADKLKQILENDFIEFGSTGKVYKYAEGDVFDSKANKDITYEILNYSFRQLAPDVVLMIYKVKKTDLRNNKEELTLRSSIWRKKHEDLKMVFHQGTRTKNNV